MLTILAADSDTPVLITYGTGPVAAQYLVNGAIATEAEFEAALSPGDDITHQAADAATGTTERITLVSDTLNNNCAPAVTGDPEVCSTPDNIVAAADTLDVENPAGGVLYAAFNYAALPAPFNPVVRYFVDGTEGTIAEFELGLAQCIPNADTDCSIEVVSTVLATFIRLDTDTTV